jgi:hypothetical protein
MAKAWPKANTPASGTGTGALATTTMESDGAVTEGSTVTPGASGARSTSAETTGTSVRTRKSDPECNGFRS